VPALPRLWVEDGRPRAGLRDRLMADDRTYIRVHDGLDDHPKIEGLSDAAFRALLRCWALCSRQLTDGRLTDAAFRNRAKTPRVRRELVDAELVHLPDYDCPHEHCPPPPDGHVQMHDYLDHQRSAAEVAELKRKRAEAGRRGGYAKANGLALAKQTPQQTPSKTVPSTETETDTYLETSLQGGSHVSSGSPAAPPLFADHCQRHANDPTPGKCGDCADARKARAAMPHLALVVSERPPWCGSCNEFTRLIDSNGDGPSRRCTVCHPLALEAS
jgi:hypothetical protein